MSGGRTRERLLMALACAVTVSGCARQGAPPGGPVDRTAPRISETRPTSGTAGVALDAAVEIDFSEPMQRDEVERALYIFPAPPAPPRSDWRGTTLRLAPDTAWQEDQTYIITLQVDARDQRGNRLAQSLQMAFSTGADIDSGRISGTIIRAGRPAPGYLALCYRLGTEDADPELDTADYVVQADSAGRFAFDFLSPGRYRVFGLEDRDRDWLWNVGVEPLAVPAQDLAVGEGPFALELPPLHLAALDTVRPTVAACTPWGAQHIRIELDRPALARLLLRSEVWLEAEGGLRRADGLRVRDTLSTYLFAEFDPPARGGAMHWNVPALDIADTCTVTRKERTDEPAQDPEVSPGPHATLIPDRVILRFYEPVVSARSERVQLLRDTVSIDLGQVQVSGFDVTMDLIDTAYTSGPLRLRVDSAAFDLASGNHWPADSARNLAVGTPHRDSMGSFDLGWSLPSAVDTTGLLLGVVPAGDPRVARWYPWAPHGRINGDLLRGDYLLRLFADRDRDGRWSPGWPRPFEPAEALWYLEDTLSIRARFVTEITIDAVSKK